MDGSISLLIGLFGLNLLGLTANALNSNDSGMVIRKQSILNCSKNEFKCSIDHKCIPMLKVQDGIVDCIDNSDEGKFFILFFYFLNICKKLNF